MCVIYIVIDVMIVSFVLFFFVKQKTAYDVRISDWSSDVCSSDLTRFMGVTATLKPWKRAPRVSMGRFPSGGDRAGGEWAPKQDHNSPFKKPAKMPAGSRRPRPQVKPI